MTAVEMAAVFAPSPLVTSPDTYEFETANGGIRVTKYRDGQEVGAIQLIGDDALHALDMLNNANDRYPVEQVLADLYGGW